MSKKNGGKLGYTLQAISVIPVLVLGLVVMFLASRWFTRAMYTEVQTELENTAWLVEDLTDAAWQGDYELVGDGDTGLQLYKGDVNITMEYDLYDHVKEETGMDITLFYLDTRILTTLCNSDGERIVGTGAPETVVAEVLEQDSACFYPNAIVNKTSYFSYYLPIHNSNGSVVGMIFVGKPSEDVEKAIQDVTYPIIIIVVITMIVISLLLFLFTNKLVKALEEIRNFLSDVAAGNLGTKLSAPVTGRSDELGDIGRSALSMQQSLRVMVEQDALTGLYNRRSGDRRLRELLRERAKTPAPFAVCIGDIDFFKKVNDTYGHDCGDLVLKNVAERLRAAMHGNGFVARWGGEEFLLVFDHTDVKGAQRILQQLLASVRIMDSDYNGTIVKVTMTFGVTDGSCTNMTQLLREADDLLYNGKTSGRNRVISG